MGLPPKVGLDRRSLEVVERAILQVLLKPCVEGIEICIDFFLECLAIVQVVCLNGNHHASMLHYANKKDIERLAELETLLFPDNCLNEHSLYEELGTSRAFIWRRPAIGYCLVRFGPEIIDLLRVGVHPDFQGRGVGQSMLEEVLKHAYIPVMLTVRRDNTRARGLYDKLGFRVIGMLPQTDGLLMLRPLTSEST